MHTLRTKLFGIFLALGVGPLIVLGIINIYQTRSSFQHSIERELLNVAKVKESALHDHYAIIKLNALTLARMSDIQNFLNQYYETQGNVENDYYPSAYELMREYQEAHWGVFHHVFLTDKNGKVILSPPHGNATTSHAGHSIASSPFFIKALGSTQITDFFGFEETDHYHQLLLQPVKDDNGNPIGVLVFEIDLGKINDVLKANFKIGENSSVFLATLKGFKVVRDKADFSSTIHSQGIIEALQKGHVVGEFVTNDGQNVIGMYIKDNEYPWVIGIEAASAEVFAPIRRQIWWLVFIVLAVAGVVVVSGMFFGRYFGNPLLEMANTAKEIADGNWDQRITPSTVYQEAYYLAESFNYLVDTVQDSTRALQEEKKSVEKRVEAAVRESEEQQRYLQENAEKMLAAMNRFTSGDLKVQLPENVEGVMGELFRGFNHSVSRFRMLIEKLMEVVNQTLASASQIRNYSEEIARSAQEQSAQANDVAAAVEEMTQTITQNSQNAARTAEIAAENGVIAQEGQQIVEQTIEKMSEIAGVVEESSKTVARLGESSTQIGEIVSVINEIAEQTNLLALNAAIEAARAGEQGKGFAVVADEVRKLAERTTEATKRIANMIEAIQNETEQAVIAMNKGTEHTAQGMEHAEKAKKALQKIVKSAEDLVNNMNQIASASKEQTSASEVISRNVEGISSLSSQTANGIAEIVHAADELNHITNQLQEIMFEFNRASLESRDNFQAPSAGTTTTPPPGHPEGPAQSADADQSYATSAFPELEDLWSDEPEDSPNFGANGSSNGNGKHHSLD